jgi:hypothetical protein
MKHYYVEIDTFVSRNNPGHRFCNTKGVVVFEKFQEMKDFLENRKYWDFSAQRVSRRYAETHAERITAPHNYDYAKGIPLCVDGKTSDCYIEEDCVVTYGHIY